MGFQELCLLCYGTQRLRHNQVGRVAQSPLPNWYGRVFSWYLSPGAHVPDLAKLASQRPQMAR